MAKTISYRLANGQVGTREAGGGILLDQPDFSAGNLSAAGQTIPVAAFPVEQTFWIAPGLIAADALVSAYADQEPRQQAAPKYVVQSIRMSFNAAFAAAAASFNVLIRRWTSAGVLVGTVATMFNGVTDTAVAFAMIEKLGAALANASLDPGDSLTFRVTINGAGAACPAFGGQVDIQA